MQLKDPGCSSSRKLFEGCLVPPMEPHLYIAATLLSLNAFYMTKSVCWELYLNSRVGRDPALVSLFEARPKETEIAKKEVLKTFFTPGTR